MKRTNILFFIIASSWLLPGCQSEEWCTYKKINEHLLKDLRTRKANIGYIYTLTMKTEGVQAWAYLSDALVTSVTSKSARQSHYSSKPLNLWAKPGENTLSFEIKPTDPNIKVTLMVEKTVKGKTSLVWKFSTDKIPANTTLKRKTKLNFPHLPTRRFWRAAPIKRLTSTHKQQIYKYLQCVHKIYQSKKTTQVNALSQPIIREIAFAKGVDFTRFDKQAREANAELMKARMKALPTLEDLTFNISAQGRLVQLLDKQGESPIQALFDDGSSMSQALHVSFLQGKWMWTF